MRCLLLGHKVCLQFLLGLLVILGMGLFSCSVILVFGNCLQIKKFEKLESDDERIKTGRAIYDQYIMRELLSQSHVRIAISVIRDLNIN